MPRYRHASEIPAQYPAILVDHSRIPADDLEMAKRNHRPWESFPWRDLYPLAGSTVYFEGQLYSPYARVENDPLRGSVFELVKLMGWGHDGEAVARRCDLRPVVWSQDDEDAFQERQRCRFVVPHPMTYLPPLGEPPQA